jgi:hypothetical protein
VKNIKDDLFLKLEEKGFTPVEIPDLIKDILNILGNGERVTKTTINQELESLGWGIDVIENVEYRLLTSLLGDNNP